MYKVYLFSFNKFKSFLPVRKDLKLTKLIRIINQLTKTGLALNTKSYTFSNVILVDFVSSTSNVTSKTSKGPPLPSMTPKPEV